jgi:RNA polymerase sigma-54 factor
MRFDAFQQMRMGQHMKLAPHMIQSMEILQMSLAELQERIEQELESNATLEVADGDGTIEMVPGGPAPDTLSEGTREDRPLDIGDKSGEHDFERLGSFEDENPEVAENQYEDRDTHQDFDRSRSSGEAGEGDAKSEAMANTAARGEGLTEQLIEQWRMSDVEEALKPLGEYIITYIEDDGYLRTPLELIAERAAGPALNKDGSKPTVAQVEAALKAVQLILEPAGIGARDTRECLLIQIDAREDEKNAEEAKRWELVRTVVEKHLDDVANNRLPKVAQKLGVTVDELKAILEQLKTLRLAPARQLSSEAPPGIVPDGIVEYDADRRLPNLRINEEYAKLARDKTAPKPTREFIKTNLNNASFLIEAIEQRKRTLLRVLEAVVAAQREFFDYGPQAIKPLPMTKVAEQLGVHVATVSRAVAEKYIQTPRGVVALRKFFTGGTTTDAGEEISWEAIKSVLLDVIGKEDKKNPLSDDALADELKKHGFEIARRTVAKYRGQLNIPTGRLRKEH